MKTFVFSTELRKLIPRLSAGELGGEELVQLILALRQRDRVMHREMVEELRECASEYRSQMIFWMERAEAWEEAANG